MQVYGEWKVTLPDEEYIWNPDEIPGSVWNQLETDLGMTYKQFFVAVDDRKFRACQWLIWYLRRTAGSDEDRLGIDFLLTQLEIVKVATDPDPEAPAADTPPSDDSGSSRSSASMESDPATGTI